MPRDWGGRRFTAERNGVGNAVWLGSEAGLNPHKPDGRMAPSG